jgi:hypothetical protein
MLWPWATGLTGIIRALRVITEARKGELDTAEETQNIEVRVLPRKQR